MATACLLGNGTSIAYNRDLSVGNLTSELLAAFDAAAGGSTAGDALKSFADQVTGSPEEQFERLLGPLESTALALTSLSDLTPIASAGPAAITAALGETQTFLSEVHRRGLGIVLERIASHGQGHADAFAQVSMELAGALIGLGPSSQLTVATLNYDGLTHAGLMESGLDEWGTSSFGIADLADGRTAQQLELFPGATLEGFYLRTGDTFPPERATILHLHGYLGWLRSPQGHVVKFSLEDLRDYEYWNAFADGGTQWTPVVVLTDRKADATLRWPFNMAYDVFASRLVTADRWMIAGYGMGDEPVNALFRQALITRHHLGLAPPRCIVIDYGSPAEAPALLAIAREKLGLPDSTIVTLDGIPNALNSAEWNDFAA